MPFRLVIATVAALVISPAVGAANPAPIETDIPVEEIPAEAGELFGETPADATGGLSSASRSAKARHGLGFPSWSELLGKRWKQKAKGADRAFARELEESMTELPGGAARRGGPAEDFDRLFTSKDLVKGKRGKQTRSLKVETDLNGGCPHLTELKNHFGWAGKARASYEVATTERVARYDVVTAVVIDANFETRPSMHDDATSGEWSTADFGQVVITRNQVAVNRKTGVRSPIGETEYYRTTLDPFYRPEGGFLAFVNSQEDGAPAPPRPLRSGAWDDVAENFIAIPYNALRTQVVAAERLAQTPNRCVEVSFEAPERLAPSESTDIRGIPRQTEADTEPSLILPTTGRIRAEWVNNQGQTATPNSMEAVHEGGVWYSFTAPPEEWPADKPVGLEFTYYSSAGIASSRVEFALASSEIYFEVLDAKIETHTEASRSSSYCGEVGGSQSFGGPLAAEPFTDTNHLKTGGGAVSGQIEAKVTSRWYDHEVFGCSSEDDNCQASLPDRTPAGGTSDIGVYFHESETPGAVDLGWIMYDPSVGFVDAGDAECNAYVWGYFPQETAEQTIALSELRSPDPITLTLAGTGHLDVDGQGDPASIDHIWEYSLTVQAVDESGEPLG